MLHLCDRCGQPRARCATPEGGHIHDYCRTRDERLQVRRIDRKRRYVTIGKHIGLPNGFVRFNTVAHLILRFMLEHGDTIAADVAYEGITTSTTAATTLAKLRQHGFILGVGRLSKYDSGESKTQNMYSLKRHRRPSAYAPATQQDRDARRATRRRPRSSFIFNTP